MIMESFPFPWMDACNTAVHTEPQVVMAKGVRLFRNLHAIPFPENAAPAVQRAAADTVNKALDTLESFSGAPRMAGPYSANQSACMLESRLVTPVFAKTKHQGQEVRFSHDRRFSALINGGEHLTLSTFSSTGPLPELWSALNRLDDALSRQLRFAFHPQFGYLSADPANAGSSMEAVSILHLPGLALQNETKNMLAACTRLGLKCTGIFESSNKFPGNLYVLSNLSKLGETEEECLARFEKVTAHIAGEELQAREKLFRNEPAKAADFCYRSLAVLKYARMISSVEALNALSGLFLARENGVAPELLCAELPAWDRLILAAMPGHISAGLDLPGQNSAAARAVRRAEVLRAFFAGEGCL